MTPKDRREVSCGIPVNTLSLYGRKNFQQLLTFGGKLALLSYMHTIKFILQLYRDKGNNIGAQSPKKIIN